jgi:hypothetical protein
MENDANHLDTLFDLETQHDDLLRRLAELDRQVEDVLRECLAVRRSGETAESTR